MSAILTSLFTKLAGDGVGIVKKLVKDKDLAAQLENELKKSTLQAKADFERLGLDKFKAEVVDRERATGLYKTDAKLQKVFAVVFLIGYIVVTFTVMYGAYMMTVNDMVFNNETVAIITMLFTAMSNKINTIVDFLFGGSADKQKQ